MTCSTWDGVSARHARVLSGATQMAQGIRERTWGVRRVSLFRAVKKGNATDAPCFSASADAGGVATRNLVNLRFSTNLLGKAAGIAIGRDILKVKGPAGSWPKLGLNNKKTVLGAAKKGNAMDAPCFRVPGIQRLTATRDPADQRIRPDFPAKASELAIGRVLLEGATKAGSAPKQSPNAEKTGGVHRVSYFRTVNRANATGFLTRKGANH